MPPHAVRARRLVVLLAALTALVLTACASTPRDAGGSMLDVARGHPQRSMMLAAHLFARTPAGGAADEATFEDALAGLLDAEG